MSAILTPEKLSPGRMGELLANSRLDASVDLELLAAQSSFTVGELSDIEAGHRILRPKEAREIENLYRHDCGLIIPNRHPLRIDLVDGTVSADGNSIALRALDDDHVLDRYLSLVYSMRSLERGSPLHLRDEDIAILATSLSEREDLVLRRLHDAMDSTVRPDGRFPNLLHALRLGALPGVAGAVSIGAVALLGGETAQAETPTAELDETPPVGANLRERIVLRDLVVSSDRDAGLDESAAREPVVLPDWPAWGQVLVVDSVQTDEPAPTDYEVDVDNHQGAEVLGDLAVDDTTAEVFVESMPVELRALTEAQFPVAPAEILPGWTIDYQAERPGLRGLTLWESQTIEIYVRDTDTPELLAGVLAHEIGHAVDIMYLQDVDRLTWLQARGIDSRTWWPNSAANDFSTGAGDFAEAFAFWAVGDSSTSELGGDPTEAQLRLLETFVSRGSGFS